MEIPNPGGLSLHSIGANIGVRPELSFVLVARQWTSTGVCAIAVESHLKYAHFVFHQSALHPKFKDDGRRPGTFGNGVKSQKIDYILLSPELFNSVENALARQLVGHAWSYSYLSACVGSSCDARRAGRYEAAN